MRTRRPCRAPPAMRSPGVRASSSYTARGSRVEHRTSRRRLESRDGLPPELAPETLRRPSRELGPLDLRVVARVYGQTGTEEQVTDRASRRIVGREREQLGAEPVEIELTRR